MIYYIGLVMWCKSSEGCFYTNEDFMQVGNSVSVWVCAIM